jgi:hypothetical protein
MPMIAIAPLIPEPVKQQILKCGTEDDWDDEGAVGITTDLCNVAIDFINAVLNRDASVPIPKVSPSVFGTVTLAWRKMNSHLIVRPAINSVYYRYEDRRKNSTYGTEPPQEAILRIIQFFDSYHAEKD